MARLFPLAAIAAIPFAAAAADRWIQFRSGPFEVYTDGGAREGREALVRFEEVRHAFGQITGEADPQTRRPVRIILLDDDKDLRAYGPPPGVIDGRDRDVFLLPSKTKIVFTPMLLRDVARLLLEGAPRLPGPMEQALLDLFSTIEVSGIRITLGKPVPPEQRSFEWARLHLLATSEQYYGRLRTLIGNLRRGVAEGPAYRNSLGKEPEEVRREAEAYLKAGNFPTTSVNARPLSVDRDFSERALGYNDARLAMADLLMGERSRKEYEALIREKVHIAEAEEGLGLMALRAGDKEAARAAFGRAVSAGPQAASVFLHYARLEPDPVKAREALNKAIGKDPKNAEARFLAAGTYPNPEQKLEQLKLAASLDPRNLAYWKALAETHLELHQYADAAKAWRGAELAAATPEEKKRMFAERMKIEEQRLEWEDAERKRIAAEKEAEIRALKEKAMAEVRALEQRYNKDAPGAQGGPVVPWWDGPKAEGKVTGTLKQIDCLGRRFRVVITAADGKPMKLLIADAGKVTLSGGGEQTLSCGPQKARQVAIEYHPKTDPKLGTAGEIVLIDFR